MNGVRVRWFGRDRPLPPVAVVAEGRVVAAALLWRVLSASDEDLSGWAGAFAPGSAIVALLSARPDTAPLPWADGVRYLGRDPDGPPGLLLPTALRPSAPVALLHRSLRLRHPGIEEPFAVWPTDGGDGLRVLPLHRARPLDRAATADALSRLEGALL